MNQLHFNKKPPPSTETDAGTNLTKDQCRRPIVLPGRTAPKLTVNQGNEKYTFHR